MYRGNANNHQQYQPPGAFAPVQQHHPYGSSRTSPSSHSPPGRYIPQQAKPSVSPPPMDPRSASAASHGQYVPYGSPSMSAGRSASTGYGHQQQQHTSPLAHHPSASQHRYHHADPSARGGSTDARYGGPASRAAQSMPQQQRATNLLPPRDSSRRSSQPQQQPYPQQYGSRYGSSGHYGHPAAAPHPGAYGGSYNHHPAAFHRSHSASPREIRHKFSNNCGVLVDERDQRTGAVVATYKCGRFIGKGGFAEVYEFVDLNDVSRIYACKIIDREKIDGSQSKRKKLMAEIDIHMRMSTQENIVNFVRHFHDSHYYYLLLERLCHESLLDISMRKKKEQHHDLHRPGLRDRSARPLSNGQFSVPEVQWIMLSLLRGIAHLHDNHVIHRDMKLGNVLIDIHGVLKIADFGFATEVNNGEKKLTLCGTPNYFAPEILRVRNANSSGGASSTRDRNKGYSYEVDVWALGVIMYTLAIGTPPFETHNVELTYDRIKRCEFNFPPELPVSDKCQRLIRRILQSQPEHRPSLVDIRSDPFFHDPPAPTEPPATLVGVDRSLARRLREIEEAAAVKAHRQQPEEAEVPPPAPHPHPHQERTSQMFTAAVRKDTPAPDMHPTDALSSMNDQYAHFTKRQPLPAPPRAESKPEVIEVDSPQPAPPPQHASPTASVVPPMEPDALIADITASMDRNKQSPGSRRSVSIPTAPQQDDHSAAMRTVSPHERAATAVASRPEDYYAAFPGMQGGQRSISYSGAPESPTIGLAAAMTASGSFGPASPTEGFSASATPVNFGQRDENKALFAPVPDVHEDSPSPINVAASSRGASPDMCSAAAMPSIPSSPVLDEAPVTSGTPGDGFGANDRAATPTELDRYLPSAESGRTASSAAIPSPKRTAVAVAYPPPHVFGIGVDKKLQPPAPSPQEKASLPLPPADEGEQQHQQQVQQPMANRSPVLPPNGIPQGPGVFPTLRFIARGNSSRQLSRLAADLRSLRGHMALATHVKVFARYGTAYITQQLPLARLLLQCLPLGDAILRNACLAPELRPTMGLVFNDHTKALFGLLETHAASPSNSAGSPPRGSRPEDAMSLMPQVWYFDRVAKDASSTVNPANSGSRRHTRVAFDRLYAYSLARDTLSADAPLPAELLMPETHTVLMGPNTAMPSATSGRSSLDRRPFVDLSSQQRAFVRKKATIVAYVADRMPNLTFDAARHPSRGDLASVVTCVPGQSTRDATPLLSADATTTSFEVANDATVTPVTSSFAESASADLRESLAGTLEPLPFTESRPPAYVKEVGVYWVSGPSDSPTCEKISLADLGAAADGPAGAAGPVRRVWCLRFASGSVQVTIEPPAAMDGAAFGTNGMPATVVLLPSSGFAVVAATPEECQLIPTACASTCRDLPRPSTEALLLASAAARNAFGFSS